MLNPDPITLPAEAGTEAATYLRIEGQAEDVLVAGLMRSAAELCEGFIAQALMVRGFREIVPTSSAWIRLTASPVSAIIGVEALPVGGAAQALPVDAYAIDIDANGDGWVRVTATEEAPRIRVTYQAGLASEWGALPEALRQGMVRLTAHLFTYREPGRDAAPPAAVTALWRPWRRMRLR